MRAPPSGRAVTREETKLAMDGLVASGQIKAWHFADDHSAEVHFLMHNEPSGDVVIDIPTHGLDAAFRRATQP